VTFDSEGRPGAFLARVLRVVLVFLTVVAGLLPALFAVAVGFAGAFLAAAGLGDCAAL
jgi:hypothetical protein